METTLYHRQVWINGLALSFREFPYDVFKRDGIKDLLLRFIRLDLNRQIMYLKEDCILSIVGLQCLH